MWVMWNWCWTPMINQHEIGLILLTQFERVFQIASKLTQYEHWLHIKRCIYYNVYSLMFIYQCREVNKQRICLDGGTSLLKKLLCFDRIIFFLTIIDKIYLDPNLIAITFHSKDILKLKHHNQPIISYHL
jgi:hypothetical protein